LACILGRSTFLGEVQGKERERETKKRSISRMVHQSAVMTLLRYVFVVLRRDDPLCFSLYFHNF